MATEIGELRARFTAEAQGIKAEIKNVKKDITDLGHSANESSSGFSKLNSALSDVGASSKQIQKINEALLKANPELLRKQIATVTSELKKFGASDADIAKVTRELEKGALGASGYSKEIKGLGAAYAGVAVAMGAMIVKSVQTSAAFEQAMANVKAISQATGNELEKLRKQAIDLGAATVFSASQAADAQANLAQAGFKTNDIIAAMPGVLSLAAAGQTDLATTADISASILNGFNLKATETSRVVDVLAKASIDTNAGVEDLGLAMKYLGPVAQAMGISVEEATAAVGELSNAGIKGEQAGTSLRAMLLQLASPSKEAAFYMDKLGVSIKDSAGNILPLSNIIGQMQGAFARLTQAQQADVAATLVGQEAATGFIALITQGKASLDNYTASLKDSGGTAQEVAGTQMDTLKGSIDNLQSALESAGITIGDEFAPMIRKVAETITDLVTSFSNMNPELRSAIITFAAVTAGVLGLTAAVGALAIAFAALDVAFPILGVIALVIGAVSAGVAALVAHSNAAAEAVKKHDEAQKELNETLNKSPLSNTVQDLENLRNKTGELTKVLHERAGIEQRLKEIEAAGNRGEGTPQMLSEAMDINDQLDSIDKKLRTMGYDGVDDATDRLKQMETAIKNSTAALFQEKEAEIQDMAAKKQHVDSMDQALKRYEQLSAKQKLSAAETQELANITETLRKEYPDLNGKIDEHNRIRKDGIKIIETQISTEKSFVDAAAQAQQTYINNLIKTTEVQRAQVAAQIANYEQLLKAMNAVANKPSQTVPNKNNPATSSGLAKHLDPGTKAFLNTRYDDYVKSVNDKKNAAYEKQYEYDEQIKKMKQAAASLQSGSYANNKIKNPIDLSKPGKTPKSKSTKSAGKTAAELAEEAAKKSFDADMATVRYRADMYDQTADQQIAAYKKVQTAHQAYLKKHIEDERTLNLQIKNLTEQSAKERYDASSEWIEKDQRRMEESGKSEVEMASKKLAIWTNVRNRYKKDSEEYKQADEQVYQARKDLTAAQEAELRKQYDASADWIEAEERRMQDAGKSEQEIATMKLEAWSRVRDHYKKDSDLYKQAEKELYEARKGLIEKTNDLIEDSLSKEKDAIESAKKADLDAIDKRKQEYLDAQNEKISAIDELLKKEEELNADADYETKLAEKKARQSLLSTAVSPEGRKELADITAEIERMQLEHSRDLRKRDLEDQKDKLENEKDQREKAFDKEKQDAEDRYDALTQAFEDHKNDIEFIENAIKDFRVGANQDANAQILTDLDKFVADYRSKISQITNLTGIEQPSYGPSTQTSSTDSNPMQAALDLAEYNANKDAWDAAKSRGDKAEMKRLSMRNEEIRKIYGIEKDTGRLNQLPSYDVGGVIPGPVGAPMPAIVHGGEVVLNPGQLESLFRLLESPRIFPVTDQTVLPAQQVINQFDMSVGKVELVDQTDAEIMYTERERAARRLATTGGGK